MSDGTVDWMTGWLGWIAGRLTGWMLVDQFKGWLRDWGVNWLTTELVGGWVRDWITSWLAVDQSAGHELVNWLVGRWGDWGDVRAGP